MSRQQPQQQQQQQQPPPLDPRLMPPGSAPAMDGHDAHYHRQSQPMPYPVQHAGQSQARVYTETRPVESNQPQPYFGIPGGRSPSDEMPDMIDSDRRESGGLGVYSNQSPNGDPSDQKRSRACEACRGLKVKCDMTSLDPNEPCKRCKKAGRQCIVTPPSRRRQKKSDTRVAELERKIDALTAVIAQQNGAYQAQPQPPQQQQARTHSAPDPYPMHAADQSMPPQSLPGSAGHHESRPPMSASTPTSATAYRAPTDYPRTGPDSQRSVKRRRVDASPDTASTKKAAQGPPEDPDIHHNWESLRHELHTLYPQTVRAKVRELVEPEVMRQIFDHYISDLCPCFPAVPFPPGTTADDVLESKPLLLFAIMGVGCTFVVSKELRQALYDEVLAVLSSAILQKGIKSVEIVQAIQVTCLWQKPPDKPHAANFYAMIHMSAVMCLDLGLGKRFNPAKLKRGFGGPGSDMPPGPPQLVTDSDTVEARRAWMVSYFMCASISQVLRRPNLLRWTNYMGQCVEALETSPDAAASDRLLAQHVKIQHICEEINQSFALDDPEATSISILDPKVAYTLQVLESQLREWEAQIPADLRKPGLMFFAHTTALYLHEIALHVNHNTDDFRVPFTESSLKSGSENGFAATLTQNQMISIEACLKASHAAIDTFCSFDLEMQIVLPPLLYFVRIIYALIVLIKLHVAVCSPGSELGKIIKPTDVKAVDYLNKLWAVFESLIEHHKMAPHHKARHILGILRDWVGSHQSGDSSTAKPGANAADCGMHAPQQPQQLQQYPPQNNSNESLRVLSEAATAGANPQQQNASWTFDSPNVVSYAPYTMRSNSSNPPHSSAAQHDCGSAGSSTVISTPQTYAGNDPYGNNMFGQQGQPGFGKSELDWTAGMDFEQAVNVALQDLDFSGDLFGSFFGNGADAFQIPSDGVLGGANQGGNGNWNAGQGGR